ncbi:PAS domain S-box protein [Desulfospira joergensenii]|uniref:PAS domain S-box protein n=1 Tax=Desulfospira joergensenii TaxID=53329 RepID=UPI0003B63163|nr:PAS domain S-box protein [Desulfospira joergensenii]
METPPLPKERSYIYIIALIWLVILIFVIFSGVTIFRDREIYIDTSHTKSKSQAQLLGENTSSVLYGVDLTLLSILSNLEHLNKPDTRVPKAIAKTIKDRSMFLPQIKNIVLWNAEKKVLYSLRAFQAFDDPAFFEAHRDAWLEFSIQTLISKQDKKIIVMSRRIENGAGEFAGVLAAVIDPMFFYDRYERYLNIDVDAVVLLDVRGNVLTQWYNNPDCETLHADNTPLLSMAPIKGGGLKTHETSSAVISIYQLPDFPFQIAVLHHRERILRPWYQKTKQDLLIIIATVLIGIVTMILASGQRKKRRKAEQRLMEHKDHLEDTVEKRTLGLKKANQKLVSEIEERHRMEKELLNEKQLSEYYINSLPGLFYVFDEQRFIIWNSKWGKLIGYTDEELSGMRGIDFFEDDRRIQIKGQIRKVFQEGSAEFEAEIVTKDGRRLPYFFTGVRKKLDGKKLLIGLGVDITERKIAEENRKKLIKDLQEALEEIKTLKGIVPICSSCKKIRDDKGYWNLLETYIEKHSEASFSHGLCPECSDELYGDQNWYIEMKKEKGGKKIIP